MSPRPIWLNRSFESDECFGCFGDKYVCCEECGPCPSCNGTGKVETRTITISGEACSVCRRELAVETHPDEATGGFVSYCEDHIPKT